MLVTLVALLFFLSGFTGLVYEVVWAKYFALLLGSTAYAQVGVLAVFMAGLAGGARLWGGFAETAARPLRLYGHLELTIGLSALAFVATFDSLTHLYWVSLSSLGDHSVTRLVVKILACALTMGIPTLAMGGTLPVLTRVLGDRGGVGGSVALLYAVNSFGAAVGSIVTGFLLLPQLGLDAPVVGAALINVLIGVGAYCLDASLTVTERAPRLTTAPNAAAVSRLSPQRVALAAAVCGAVAMLYEVAWIRLCSLVFGSSSYAFSVMLAAFIIGIGLGSLLYRALRPPDDRAEAWFVGLCLWAATVLLVSLPWYDRLPFWVARLTYIVHAQGGGFAAHQAMMLVVSVLVMLPMTISSGLLFPALSQAAASTGESSKPVGRVLAANTLGTIVGTVGGGLWLMPLLGLHGTFLLGATVLIGLAALVQWRRGAPMALARVGFGLAGLALGGGLARGWNLKLLSVGEFRRHEGIAAQDFSSYRDSLIQELLYYRDGATTTVSVERQEDGETTLRVNGKADASSRGDADTQLLLGHLPVLLQPQARRALVIGYGSGMTVGALLQHPLKEVDVVEIASEVIAAERYFHDVNHQPLGDPRTRLIVDDARTFLYSQGEPYDVVISEPSNPWVAGIGNLFTHEYFEQIADRLALGGVLVQWFHSYESSDADVAVVLRTLQSTFRYVRVFQSNSWDLVIAAANDQGVLRDPDAAALARASGLQELGVTRSTTVLGLEVLPAAALPRFVHPGKVNQDRHPILEYSVPRAFYSGGQAQGLAHVHFTDDEHVSRFVAWDAAAFGEAWTYLQRADMLDFEYVSGLLAAWCRVAPADPALSSVLAAWLSLQGRERDLVPQLLAHADLVPAVRRGEYFRTLLGVLRSARSEPGPESVSQAGALIEAWAAPSPPGARLVLQRLGQLYTLAHQPEAAQRVAAAMALLPEGGAD